MKLTPPLTSCYMRFEVFSKVAVKDTVSLNVKRSRNLSLFRRNKTLPGGNKENHKQFKIVGVPADIQTEHLPNKVKVKFSLVHIVKASGGEEV